MHILLHACCGPCTIFPLLSLREQGHTVTGVFVNPNIHPLNEYLRRRDAMVQCAEKLDLPMIWIDEAWDIQNWTYTVSALQNQGQSRCSYCYASRFDTCAKLAKEQNFDAFCSSLLYSTFQNHEDIIKQAQIVSKKYATQFYYEDFRLGWQKGIDISKEFNLYRQNYCGCIYSEAERFTKKLNKLINS